MQGPPGQGPKKRLRFGLLGEHLSHSFSPPIHAELGDYEYPLYEKKPEELEEFIGRGNFDGLNVTIPYKRTVIPFCKSLSETARAAGSVNTIIRMPDNSLHGDNTDYYGFLYLLKKTGINPADGKILVLGSGGSSLTVQAVLGDMNAREIVVVSRKGPVTYDDLEEHNGAILIVNTTPVGMYPDNGLSPINDLGLFPQCRAVIDLIYNPARTELLLKAGEQGIPAFDGMSMLAAQAKRAAEIFMNESIDDRIIDKITAKIAILTLNIVLIGMPGSGKTSIGKALAKKMGRSFADTDVWIAETAGKDPSAIIKENGEDYFRGLETEALRALCRERGLVIATGGGVVKRPLNRRIMRQNGVMIFLDRDLGELSLSGRPISRRDGISALAAERLPLYREWGELSVPVRGIEETASDIYEILTGGFYEKNTRY